MAVLPISTYGLQLRINSILCCLSSADATEMQHGCSGRAFPILCIAEMILESDWPLTEPETT
jgi:hypothetical protein